MYWTAFFNTYPSLVNIYLYIRLLFYFECLAFFQMNAILYDVNSTYRRRLRNFLIQYTKQSGMCSIYSSVSIKRKANASLGSFYCLRFNPSSVCCGGRGIFYLARDLRSSRTPAAKLAKDVALPNTVHIVSSKITMVINFDILALCLQNFGGFSTGVALPLLLGTFLLALLLCHFSNRWK